MLREAGHADLADEWARQPAQQGQPDRAPAEDLRYRVMLAIEQSPAETRLLFPPAVRDIAAALAATRTDALVYLLPRDDAGVGLAVIVDQDGTVRWLPLVGLYTGAASPVSAFLRTRRAVEAAGTPEAAEAARQAWLPVLGTLCGWAWRAAIGPLLDVVPARTANRNADRARARGRAWRGALARCPAAGDQPVCLPARGVQLCGLGPAVRGDRPAPAPAMGAGPGAHFRRSGIAVSNRDRHRLPAVRSLPGRSSVRVRAAQPAWRDPGNPRCHPHGCARARAAGRLVRGLAAALRLPWPGPDPSPRLEPLAR